jgi:hypothetical protein
MDAEEDHTVFLLAGLRCPPERSSPIIRVHRCSSASKITLTKSEQLRDDLIPEAYRNLLLSSLSQAHAHSDDRAPLYLWFGTSHLRDVLRCLEEAGWQERSLLVWVKNNGAGALFAQYKHWYEPCFYVPVPIRRRVNSSS